MSRKSLYSLGAVIVSTLGIIIGLGQGCGSGSSLPGLNGYGGSTGADLNVQVPIAAQILGIGGLQGNGGGYGGMVSTSEPYSSSGESSTSHSTEHDSESGSRSSSMLGDDSRAIFLHVRERTPSCTRLSDEWRALDAHVTGILSVRGHRAFYGGSLCSKTWRLGSSAVSIVDFNPRIAVYGDRVFERFEVRPPAVTDLKTTVVYCRGAVFEHSESGADLGTDVRIYRKNLGLMGEIVVGKEVDGVLTRSLVRGFTVSQAAMGEGASFTARGFELKVANMGANPSAGSLSVLLDGEQLEIPLSKCWH